MVLSTNSTSLGFNGQETQATSMPLNKLASIPRTVMQGTQMTSKTGLPDPVLDVAIRYRASDQVSRYIRKGVINVSYELERRSVVSVDIR